MTKSVSSNTYPKLFLIHTPHIPYSVVSFWLRAGSRFEAKEKAGLAHLFEHINMKRTLRFPNSSKRLEYIEGKGILFGAATYQDPVYYSTIQGPNKIKEGYKVLQDGFYNTIIEKKDVISAKEPVIDELTKSQGNPFNTLWYLANRGTWPGSSLSHEPLGFEDTVGSITYSDILAFQKKYYKVSNLTVVIMAPEKRHLLEAKSYIELSGNKIIENRAGFVKEKFSSPTNLVKSNSSDNFVQVAISFRTLGDKTRREVAALRLIKNYFAGGWLSRLNQRLRIKKNITYHVDGYMRDFNDTGILRFTFSTRRVNLGEALRIFKEEKDNLIDNGIRSKELNLHKNASRIGILSRSLEKESLLMQQGWSCLAYNFVPVTTEEFLSDIDSLDSNEIKKVANKHLQDFSVVGIGNITLKNLQM